MAQPLHRGDDLLGGVVEVVGRDDVQAAVVDDLLAELGIGAFEPHHQRHLQPDFLDRGDHALGDDVALHDAAEDVDQDAFDGRVLGDDLEGRRHLLLGGAAADIEEVRRLGAIELDDVHRRHGKAGAVDHAADIAVERDIGEVELRGFDFLGVLFGDVAQFGKFGMAEQRVVVERHLGVEHAQTAVLQDDQRVHFEQAHVLLDEGLVEDREQRLGVLGRVAVELQRRR